MKRIGAGAAVVGVAILLAVAGCAQAPKPAQTLQDRLDAAVPVGSEYTSRGGELRPGDPVMPMSTGSGLPTGRFRVTLACTGAKSVVMAIQLPEQSVATFQVACGKPQHVSMTQLTGGSIGFAVRSSAPRRGTIDYYAGILRVGDLAV